MGTRADSWRRTGSPESRPTRPRSGWIPAALALLAFAAVVAAHPQPEPSGGRADAVNQRTTILDLQPYRQAQSIRIRSNTGREGTATLVNLNPGINVWYVIEVSWTGGPPSGAYHLENPNPQGRTLLLDEEHPFGVVIVDGSARYACDLFSAGPPDVLEKGRASRNVFSALCESRIYLRNPAVGHRTGLEVATEFLRDRVWGGEAVIGLGHQLMSDANRQTGTLTVDAQAAVAARTDKPGPQPALVDPAFADRVVTVPSLGISVVGTAGGRMAPGAWYATGTPGSYVSVFQPNVIDPALLQRGRQAVTFDLVEGSALCYLIAFDLDRFSLGYARGTVHPAVGWSEHIPARMKDEGLPGPDGIGDIAPLVGTGLLPPSEVWRTTAAFTAGFKRTHGAFLYGDLSRVNHGSHYGFIENGVVFSRLQPGLATVVVGDDGRVELKTWEGTDNTRLPRIRHARQNGVALVEADAASRNPAPGRFVANWGAGNWSGSQDVKLRTMRSGIALHSSGGKRYLIYAVFSSATPSAMASVFLAYRCEYAMLLDMNALEHTYLAFYRTEGKTLLVEYLMQGMREVDTLISTPARTVVRFIGYPDNRDFFYVTRRDDERGTP